MEIKKPAKVVNFSEQRTPQARLIKPGEGSNLNRPADNDLIPFVPAYDLLEEYERKLTPPQACSIALALHLALSPEDLGTSAWDLSARLESISNRLGA